VDFELHRPAKHFLVKKNMLFVDSMSGEVRPQSRSARYSRCGVRKDSFIGLGLARLCLPGSIAVNNTPLQ